MASETSPSEDATQRPTRDCPFCGESILEVAVKCKHCGEFLDAATASRPSAPAADSLIGDVVTQSEPPAPVGPVRYKGRAGNSPQVVCPHCGVIGGVDVTRVKQKKGISGGKATAAVLTAGISMLGTGLSRKEKVSQARCNNCKVTWIMG